MSQDNIEDATEEACQFSIELRVVLSDSHDALREVILESGVVTGVYWDDDCSAGIHSRKTVEELKGLIMGAFERPVVHVSVSEVS
jgi:hypothetical protein